MEKFGGRTERTQGKSEGGVTSPRCQPTGISEKCSLTRPLSCGYFMDLPIHFWCFGMSEVPAGSEHQHLSTAARMETTTTIHPPCTKKILLKGKYIFLRRPAPSPPNPPPPTTCFIIIPFCFVLLCLHLWFPKGGWMYCCWRERKDAEGHT